MGLRYQAKIDITVNGTKFLAGEEIRESISPGDADFLLREGYVEKIPACSEKGKEEKSGKESPEAAGSEPKKKDEAPEQAAGKGRNPRK